MHHGRERRIDVEALGDDPLPRRAGRMDVQDEVGRQAGDLVPELDGE